MEGLLGLPDLWRGRTGRCSITSSILHLRVHPGPDKRYHPLSLLHFQLARSSHGSRCDGNSAANPTFQLQDCNLHPVAGSSVHHFRLLVSVARGEETGLSDRYIPESHWYYAIHGMDDKAKKVMQRAYGKIAGYDIDTEYAIIKNTLAEERSQTSFASTADVIRSYLEPFKGRNKVSLVSLMIMDLTHSGVSLPVLSPSCAASCPVSTCSEITLLVSRRRLTPLTSRLLLLGRLHQRIPCASLDL